MDVDVALVPQAARPDERAVFVVVDEIRASTTLVTLLDLGCPVVYVESALRTARRSRRRSGSILVGERHLRRPAGFDFANSPTALVRAGTGGRPAILSTTNGTAILKMLRRSEHVVVGCLRNASACATAAVDLADAEGIAIRVVCAGRLRRFVLEDAVAAGVIVTRVTEVARERGIIGDLSDAARAAVQLLDRYPDMVAALLDSDGGRALQAIGEAEDIPFCAEVDASDTVPVLRDGEPMRIERLAGPAAP